MCGSTGASSCGCATASTVQTASIGARGAGEEVPMSGSGITSTYQVAGMTCSHCVNAVGSEVGAIPGVTDVRVDLAAGTVTVTSNAPLDPGQVRDAVDEAGYELVS